MARLTDVKCNKCSTVYIKETIYAGQDWYLCQGSIQQQIYCPVCGKMLPFISKPPPKINYIRIEKRRMSNREKRHIAREFARVWKLSFKGCIGIAMEIKNPKNIADFSVDFASRISNETDLVFTHNDVLKVVRRILG